MGDLGPFDRWRLPPLNSLEDIKRSLVEFQRLYENTLYVLEQFEGNGGGAADPLLSQYSPDRPPAGILFGEEYTGNAHNLTWRWANQGSSTETLEMDTALIVPGAPSGSVDLRTRWFTGSAPGTSFALSAKVISNFDAASRGMTLMILTGGTEASPTSLEVLFLFGATGNANFATRTSYTSGGTAHGATFTHRMAEWDEGLLPIWMQMRYDATSMQLSSYVSIDGYTWEQVGSAFTLGAHPLASHGIAVNTGTVVGGSARFFYVRERTDPAGLAGEVGA